MVKDKETVLASKPETSDAEIDDGGSGRCRRKMIKWNSLRSIVK